MIKVVKKINMNVLQGMVEFGGFEELQVEHQHLNSVLLG